MSYFGICFLLFACLFMAFGKEIPLKTTATDGEKSSVKKEKFDVLTTPSSSFPPEESRDEDENENEKNSLAEALRVLHRRKREISGAHRPYSSYRPLGTHRYRYPLYRKRSVYVPSDYSDGEEPYLNDMEATYDDFLEDAEKPSLFRERERGPQQDLISNAHFSSKSLYNKRTLPNFPSLRKHSLYNLENSPYDLNAMGKLYEQGKRARNSPTRGRNLDSSNHLYVALNEMNSEPVSGRYLSEGDAKERAYSNMLQNAIEGYNKASSLHNVMIRRKRASPVSPSMQATPTSSSNITANKSHSYLPTMGGNHPSKQSDRQKRAYEESPIFYDPKEEEENDFLTREYFKTIARSVGNKRKRMAYAKFEAQKRSNALDTFLENPEMLHFVQDQIKDAEEEVAKDAEDELEESSNDVGGSQEDITSQVLLSNSIARLDALERMREALYQLERLQEQEVVRKRAQSLVSGGVEDAPRNEKEKEKRRKALKERLMKEGQKEEEEERQKRKEETLRNLLKGNRRDECPVLERIVMNCLAVTEVVSGDAVSFLEPCLRHEVCYMCGSGLDVSRHECDALLSSALEASCNEIYVIPDPTNGSVNCLGAAGVTFNILGDPSRYDDKGTCTYDPCIRQLLDSR